MAKRVYNEGEPRPSRTRLWIWLAVAGALVVLLGVALEVTGQPWFCGTCHEMKPDYEGWRDGNHVEDAVCMDCHADPGIVGYFKAHVVAGARDVYVHFIKGPPATMKTTTVPPARCLVCHDKDFGSSDFPSDHPPKTEYCPECHRDEIHTNPKP